MEFSSLPPLVQEMGGYEDVAIDQFGRELAICDLAEGFIPQATQRAIGRNFKGKEKLEKEL